MATIKFKNAEDLINYLCRKDVMGKLEIDFEPDFGTLVPHLYFKNYPELEEHLQYVFGMWTYSISPPASAFTLIMYSADDFEFETFEDEEIYVHELYDFKEDEGFEMDTVKL